MPFVFIIVGTVFIVSGALGTSSQFLKLLKGDLPGFIYWMLAIGVIGALGYVNDFRGFSRALLALVLIVLLITEDKGTSGGFFTEFQQAISTISGKAA
jgi:hypothetical protein